jgi:hypothetical protein
MIKTMHRKKALEDLINLVEFPWKPKISGAPVFLFPVALPGILSEYRNMIKNTLSKWKDRSHDSITDEEIAALSGPEYQTYLAWRIQVNLDHMEAEGFVTKMIQEDGTVVYRKKTDEELQEEVDNL